MPVRTQTTVPRPVGDVLLEFANRLDRLHPERLADLIVRTGEALGAADVAVLLADVDQRSLTHLGRPGTVPIDVAGSAAGTAYRTEQPVRRAAAGGRTRLWVPLMDSAERLGVLGVTVGERDGAIDLWTGLASLAGEAIMAKMAYGDGIVLARRSREMSLAAEMRTAMLPPLTYSSPEVELSGILEPAYEIAGDTFDYSVDGPSVSLAVLDAMGHGLEASRMANLAVSAYRNGRRRGDTLQELFRSIDEVVAEQFGEQRFVTGQLARFDTTTGLLTIVNAGHPLPVLFRGGADLGDVPCRPCLPLGLGAVAATETTVTVEPGDLVLFYTDGVTEARNDQRELLGRPALGELVGSLLRRDLPLAEVLRQVAHAVHEHSGGRLRDDASLVLVRRPIT
jgi:hypothetical protein